MNPDDMKFDPQGVGQPCALAWPLATQDAEEPRVLALPLRRRPGGFMLALPASLSASLADDAVSGRPSGHAGPVSPGHRASRRRGRARGRSAGGPPVPSSPPGCRRRPGGEDGAVRPGDRPGCTVFCARLLPAFPSARGSATGRPGMGRGRHLREARFLYGGRGPARGASGPGQSGPKAAGSAQETCDSESAVRAGHSLDGGAARPGGANEKPCGQAKPVGECRSGRRAIPCPCAAAPTALPCSRCPGPRLPWDTSKEPSGASQDCRASASPPPAPSPSKAVVSGPAAESTSGDSSLAKALTQQGEALSLLVSHLVAQGESLDLGSSSSSVSGKGSAERERLQQELAAGSSTFFLQVCQGAHRRLHPALPVPASLDDMKAQGRLSLVSYLERQGGYAQQRGTGLMMLMLATIGDCFLRGDTHVAMEHLGLALAATEQSCTDNGRWDLGFLLTLLEEPAPSMFAPRGQAANSRLRAFSPLVPPTLGSVTLAYVREVDLLSQRAERRCSAQPGCRRDRRGRRRRGKAQKATLSPTAQGPVSPASAPQSPPCRTMSPGTGTLSTNSSFGRSPDPCGGTLHEGGQAPSGGRLS